MRGSLLDNWLERIPSPDGIVVPGMFSTLKKSMLMRSVNCSLMRTALNSEALRFQVFGPSTNFSGSGWKGYSGTGT